MLSQVGLFCGHVCGGRILGRGHIHYFGRQEFFVLPNGSSVPFGPLRVVYVWPAPESRFVVPGLPRPKIKSQSKAGPGSGSGPSNLTQNLWELLEATTVAKAVFLPPLPCLTHRFRGRRNLRLLLQEIGAKPRSMFALILIFIRDRSDTTKRDWVQAERGRRAVGRAAWMPRERRQDMDVRSARAHGASPKAEQLWR
jgi:hypothetical protein